MGRRKNLTLAIAVGLVATLAVGLGNRGLRAGLRAESEAETIAKRLLKAGSDLFDAKKADALAATYTEAGRIHMIGKKDALYDDDIKEGRAEVSRFYADLFKEGGVIDSENTVEFARLVSSDMLVIHGKFRPDVGRSELPFIQIRVKQGEAWLIKDVWIFLHENL